MKNNPELVESVFALLFETLWVPPYDRRRGNPLLMEFERCAREAARMLSVTPVAAAAPDEVAAVVRSVRRLGLSVRHVADAGLFDPDRIAGALAAAEQIESAVRRVCGDR